MTNLKRLYLLPEAEIADLYARPVFNENEQQLYFELTQVELDTLVQFGTLRTKVHFMLQLAYFKAKNQFFTFTFDDVRADVDYVLTKFFKKTGVVFQGSITRQRTNQQKQIILNLFDYQAWSVERAIQVEAHIGELLRYYPKVMTHFVNCWSTSIIKKLLSRPTEVCRICLPNPLLMNATGLTGSYC
jgi:Domain of unknown function (DUF4158)